MKQLLIVFSMLLASVCHAEEFSIATFNAEFLTVSKVHTKYGLPFDMDNATPAEQAEWSVTAFRT